MMAEAERFAPEGKLWVCCACGKTSKDQYGDPATSWDESCVLNSRLFEVSRLVYANGRVVRVTEPPALKAEAPNE
jgi:hypothetical protein